MVTLQMILPNYHPLLCLDQILMERIPSLPSFALVNLPLSFIPFVTVERSLVLLLLPPRLVHWGWTGWLLVEHRTCFRILTLGGVIILWIQISLNCFKELRKILLSGTLLLAHPSTHTPPSPPLSLSFSPIPFSDSLWQITKIQLPLSQIFVENHPELVVLLQEAEDSTSLLRLLTQRLIRNALALGTEIFLEPQGIGSGDQKLNMSFDFGSLESGDGTISKQPHGVVNWKK
jgi:hypothetical protein